MDLCGIFTSNDVLNFLVAVRRVGGDDVSRRLCLALLPIQPCLAAAGADDRYRADRVYCRGNVDVSCLAGDP